MSISKETKAKIYSLFEGDGEMASLMRNYNWSLHPMGEPDQWPESLRTIIRLMLNSAFPMFVWWSPDLYMFHNDAYLPALGKKHPRALGASAGELWAEIWGQMGGIVKGVLEQGKPFYAKELCILLDRKGFSEETYWTFSYSPAADDQGKVNGIFCACSEVTKSVLGQRRLGTVKKVADVTVQVKTVEEAGILAGNVMAKNPDDIPFSLLYVLNAEGTKALLTGRSGDLPPELSPGVTDLQQTGLADIWQLSRVQESREIIITDMPVFDHSGCPGHGPKANIDKAVVIPVFKPGEDKLIGFFVAAVSPKLEYDADYKNFHKLLTLQIATSLAGVQAREEALRQQEELVNLFQQAPVAIAILRGNNFVVELANPPMCEFWGRSFEEVIHKPVFDALPEARGQGLEELLQEVMETGTTHAFNEFSLTLNRNGKQDKIYTNFIYYPFRSSKGIITGVTAIAVEITEQVESRHEIEKKNKELVAINSDLDNFVYSASHDLKGPILNIEGLMKILLPKLPEEISRSKEISSVVNMIFGSIDRLQSTITDLSEVSRVQKEASEEVKIVNIAGVAKDVLADMQLEIRKSGAVIEENLGSFSVLFSPKNLRSIVYNLISNALKYRAPDRRPLIQLFCERKGDELILSVKDNGLGIDLKHREKIFSMFKRLHSHVEGTGVGLYIVKRIVENAGGRIEVESKIGEGSVFTIFLKV